MEAFLNALSPSIRDKTREALAMENGEARLERIASRYIDDDGKWPIDRMTADYIARTFIAESEVASAAFSPYGLKGPTIAALSAGVVTMGQSKTIISLGSKLVGKYWVEIASYALGINPVVGLAISGAIHQARTAADWAGISRGMENGFDEELWKNEFSDEYAKSLERATIGPLAQSAWRGSRSAANHIETKQTGDVSVNKWIRDYVAKVAQSQAELSIRTARHIVENSLELPSNVMAGRLEQMWALTPHHVDSVNRYRSGLAKQDRTPSWVNKMTQRYADRLLNQRVDTLTKTEAQTAFNLGRETQWVRSVKEGTLPADTMKMWITGQDEKVCEVCAPMDGKTAPLGEVFDTIELYVPSAHPNCRCIVVPVQPGVANVDEPQLVFPVYDMVDKHLKGKHDQKDHGSWATRVILGQNTDFSKKKVLEIIEELQGETHLETRDSIIDYLRNWNKSNLVEMSVALTPDNRIVEVSLGEEHETRLNNRKLFAGVTENLTIFHNHPRDDKGSPAHQAPSAQDISMALLSPMNSVVVNDLGVYEIANRKYNIHDPEMMNDPETRQVMNSITINITNILDGIEDRLSSDMNRYFPGLADGTITGRENEMLQQIYRRDRDQELWETVSNITPSDVATFRFTPWDEVSKRTITVEEYTRTDGTVVQEHDRVVTPYNGYKNPQKVVDAIQGLSRGELSLAAAKTPFGNKKSPLGYEKLDNEVYFYFDVMKGKEAVGELVFSVHKDKTAHLNWFTLEKEEQRTGFGRSVFDVGLEALRTAGIEKAKLEANIDVGGYAWAVMGVKFDPDPNFGKSGLEDKFMRHRLNYFKEHGYSYYGIVGRAKNWYGRRFSDKQSPYTAQQRTQINREIDRLIERSSKYPVGHTKSPTPQDLAALGREHRWTHEDGFSMWPGKEILLGSSWDGVLDLTQVSKSIGSTETTLAWLDGITPIDINLGGKTDYPLHRGLVTPKPEDEDRLFDEVSKRTIIIPEYERQDGTTVGRHTRVIGERDAMERWKDADPTEEHKRLAKAFTKINHDYEVEEVDPPKSWKGPSEFDGFEAWRKWVSEWYESEDGKKWMRDRELAENRARAKADKAAQEKIREDVADPELVKSAIRGSRIWTTVQGGQGLVREVADVTTPGHVPSEEYIGRKWRESEIKAVSDFINVVRSAPQQNTRVFYRGIGLPGPSERSYADYEELRSQLSVGSVIDLPVSSISEEEHIARSFMGLGIPEDRNQQVLFRFEKGAKAVRLPDPVSNPLFQEREWVTSGKYRVSRVEEVKPSKNYKYGPPPQGYTMVWLEYAGDSSVWKGKSELIDEIVDRLCTPLPRLEKLFDEVSKRTVTVEEYTRSDGTVVEEHERKIDPAKAVSSVVEGYKDSRVRDFVESFQRDGELSFNEATALGTIAAFGLAVTTRGRIRRSMTHTVYDDMGTLPDGSLVVPPKLLESLTDTYTYRSPSTGLRTELHNVEVMTAPHHTYRGQLIQERYGAGGEIPDVLRNRENNRTLVGEVVDRFTLKPNNILIEARVYTPDGRVVGKFETTIDPRKREAFQDGFFMNTNYQGTGFADEFTAHIGLRYVETGIDSIGVYAGGPVGGYAWANKDFSWRYWPSRDVVQRLEKVSKRTDVYPESVIKEIRSIQRRIRLGYTTGRFPRPKEIANIGRDHSRVVPGSSPHASTREMWAGKEIMLGSDWHASLNIREIRRLLIKQGHIQKFMLRLDSGDTSSRHAATTSVGSQP